MFIHMHIHKYIRKYIATRQSKSLAIDIIHGHESNNAFPSQAKEDQGKLDWLLI